MQMQSTLSAHSVIFWKQVKYVINAVTTFRLEVTHSVSVA